MLPQLTPERATMVAHLLPDYLPRPLELVGPGATGGERHFDVVDGAVDGVGAGRSEAETARVDFVEVGEDFEMDFCGEGGERGGGCLGGEEGEAARHGGGDVEFPFPFWFGVGGVVA